MVVGIPSKILFFLLYLGQLFACNAKDFGVHGKIAPIEEEDPIVLIQSKLRIMEERGELERHNHDLQKKTRAAIERPKPVEGISKAKESRIFYYDPTYIVPEDLKDHSGKIIHPKGMRLNPLETVTLSQELLFFDGDDEDQVTFAKEKLNEKLKEKLAESSLRLILVKGAPLALSEALKIPVYFDQSGLLSKKLGIHHVPALVTQRGLYLRIEEINLQKQGD
ncbi:MAG: type-F conjugative transfer system protein TraW [Alphaproteobacteria bacterium]|nr:type-F conjugative transfer system protein TraW [Alphaproteobacteria bacterium]